MTRLVPSRPALIRLAEQMFEGWTDRSRTTEFARPKTRMDVTPPRERPWVSPGRPPWARRDARTILSGVVDRLADAVAPPMLQTKHVKKLPPLEPDDE